MPRQLLIKGEKNFRITIPDDSKITFGPFSPPSKLEAGYANSYKAKGTLRIYQGTKDNIIACFSGVESFRDLSMGYAEEVAREEGATIWRDDELGYTRESKVSRTNEWVEPMKQLPAKLTAKRKRG